MNILHHKSWHVRTKRNIERVRRDEANAECLEKEKQRKIDLAEQESRTDFLRSKAKGFESTVTTTVVEGHSKHIELFDDFDDKTGTVNKEYEQELKREQELWEKKNKLLTTLNHDDDNNTPWYLLSHEQRLSVSSVEKLNSSVNTDSNAKQLDQNKYYDPLETMNKYLKLMKTNKNKDKTDKTNKHSDKNRHKNHSRHSNKDKKIKSSSKSQTKSIEELRAERLIREKHEKERTRQLLESLKHPNSNPMNDTVITDDRLRTYNSQFNPQIARQNEKRNQIEFH